MRSYSVAVTAIAIRAPVKWLDNLLSQHEIDDVAKRSRGRARRIARRAVTRLAIVRELHESVGCGVREAVALADRLLTSEDACVQAGGHLSVQIARVRLDAELDRRLGEALESAPTPRRGRPPKRRAARDPAATAL